MKKRCMNLNIKLSSHRGMWSVLLVILMANNGTALSAEPGVSESVEQPASLMGEWCYEKKRRVTKYTVKDGSLRIRSGRSGQLYEAALTCDDAYTVCEAKTIRGWGTPVTETLQLDGDNMNLTRVWGGAWKDKTYNFIYTRCPKW